VLLAEIALFGLSSLLCGLTSTAAVLIAGRESHGLAALTCPAALLLVAYAVPLPLYVGALRLAGLCTGMRCNVGRLAWLLRVVGLLTAASQRTSGQPAAPPQPR
jgi:hypothetical protein